MRMLLLLLGLTLCGGNSAEAQLPVGATAPEIEAKDWFNEPAGTSLASLRGKVVFIEFWATW